MTRAVHEEALVGAAANGAATRPLRSPSFTRPWVITRTAAWCGSFQWLPGRTRSIAARFASSTTS